MYNVDTPVYRLISPIQVISPLQAAHFRAVDLSSAYPGAVPICHPSPQWIFPANNISQERRESLAWSHLENDVWDSLSACEPCKNGLEDGAVSTLIELDDCGRRLQVL